MFTVLELEQSENKFSNGLGIFLEGSDSTYVRDIPELEKLVSTVFVC